MGIATGRNAGTNGTGKVGFMRGMNQLLRENICMFNGPVKSVGRG